tara:strand:- start:351 stop:1394 length:1044 start_codon:yes stop_codon:yes gene_type:complete
MAAIPILIYDKGFVDLQEGTLLSPPIELFSGAQKAYYSRAPFGWSACPLGYQVYCARDDLGRRIVIPGTYPPNSSSPKRKFPQYPLRFSKAQIENFAASHLNVVENVREQRDREFKNLTHDLRAIGNEIYHGALAAREALGQGNRQKAEEKINLIVNSQQMMSLRLDIVDYEGGLSSERPKDLIDPYPKVDKVLRSFSGKFASRRMSYNIHGRTRNKIFGPPIFEIVPFVIIENALKYAPHSSEITIRYQEDEGKTIIRFESLGPRITEAENKKIFQKDYRGDAAKEAGRSGSGIGLFAAKTIVEEHFDGKIFVNQLEQEAIIGGEHFFNTRFTVVLPSENDDRHRR